MRSVITLSPAHRALAYSTVDVSPVTINEQTHSDNWFRFESFLHEIRVRTRPRLFSESSEASQPALRADQPFQRWDVAASSTIRRRRAQTQSTAATLHVRRLHSAQSISFERRERAPRGDRCTSPGGKPPNRRLSASPSCKWHQSLPSTPRSTHRNRTNLVGSKRQRRRSRDSLSRPRSLRQPRMLRPARRRQAALARHQGNMICLRSPKRLPGP